MMNENPVLCRLDYMPITSDPERGLFVLPDDDPEELDVPGPLMNFVLSMGQYFTAGALFAAVALMLMVAGAGM